MSKKNNPPANAGDEVEKLKPCPLCGNENVWDKGYGISCDGCGLWLGDGTQAGRMGGYKKLWNHRPAGVAEKTDTTTPFVNNKGHVIVLDDKLTVKDLVKLGVKEIRLVPPSAPLPDNWYCGVDLAAPGTQDR